MHTVKRASNSIEKQLAKDFRKIIVKLAEYLKQPIINKKLKIKIQEEKSTVEIPDYGKGFGVRYEQEQLILANWLFKLPIKEKETIINFLLVREGFRCSLNEKITSPHQYGELIEVLLNIIATLWIIYDKQYDFLLNPRINYIRARTIFDGNKLFKYLDWERYLIFSYRYNISAFQIFDKLIHYVNLGIENKRSLEELIQEVRSWLDKQIQEGDFLALPLFMKKRHFDVMKSLISLGADKGSTKNIGRMLNLSHDVIDVAFKELYEEYNVFWRANVNFPLLRLYPYFFRLTLTKKKYLEQFVKKFKTIRYMKELFVSPSKEGTVLTVYFPSPHIVHHQLEVYFEKLVGKKIIKEYFFQMVRRRKLFSAITTESIEPTEEIYQQILNNPTKYNYQTFTLWDKVFDITSPPKKKRTVFNEDVLYYISAICARHLTKAHYMFYLPELYDLCKRNNIEPKDTRAFMYFINQLDIRCRRLGLLEYFLNIQKIGRYRSVLYFELLIEPDNRDLKALLQKLTVSSTSLVWEFYDRVIIGFPRISANHPFRGIVEDLFRKEEIAYFVYPSQLNLELDRFIPYHELYDYDEKRWKFN